MDDKEYYIELGKIRTRRLNEIINAVNCKVKKLYIGLKNEVEERFYEKLIEEANEHLEKYGSWPVFEMGEIEYDAPVLDIYKDDVKDWR